MTGQLLHKFRNHGPLSRRTKFLILALVPVYFMTLGLFLQPLNEVLKGIITIIREPDFLITDYIAIGGIEYVYQCRCAGSDFHCHCLLSGDGDERPHDYLLLSNVWFSLFGRIS